MRATTNNEIDQIRKEIDILLEAYYSG
jgi:hypothetical protein